MHATVQNRKEEHKVDMCREACRNWSVLLSVTLIWRKNSLQNCLRYMLRYMLDKVQNQKQDNEVDMNKACWKLNALYIFWYLNNMLLFIILTCPFFLLHFSWPYKSYSKQNQQWWRLWFYQCKLYQGKSIKIRLSSRHAS